MADREGLSRGDLLLLAAILAAAGVAVSAFLTWQWYTGGAAGVCSFNNYFDCERVRESPYAAVAGIPTSTVGLAGFVILLGLTVLAFRGIESLGPWRVEGWLLAFSVVGALVGLSLSFIEVFVIQAVCVFCAAGFGLDLGILATAILLRRRASHPDAS